VSNRQEDSRAIYRTALAFVTALVAIESTWLWRQYVRRQRTERMLKNVTESLSFTWRTTQLSMLEVDLNNAAVRTNENFHRLARLPAATTLTLEALFATIHPDDRRAFRNAIARAVRSGKPVESELRLVPHESDVRWIAVTLLAHTHDPPAHRGVNCLVAEITERKHIEAVVTEQRRQLAHLARVSLLGELSSALAHELNQPLTSILSNAEAGLFLIEEPHLDIQQLRDILRDIVRDDRRAGDVIGRMRALLTRGETELQRVDVGQLIDGVLMLQHSDLIARNMRLVTRIAPPLPAIHADRVEMEQVLLNLVMNASEAMSGTPAADRMIEVEATVLPDTHEVRISVFDRGRGISPAHLERVFDPFFSTKRSGLGVGLAICRSIIAAHGGRIWATTSSGQPGGSSFHFTVPIFEEECHERVMSEGLSG
jgi:C4-dicarboxylate-specific signal transduction histidine kinase